jgi:hypothetical protein
MRIAVPLQALGVWMTQRQRYTLVSKPLAVVPASCIGSGTTGSKTKTYTNL